MRRSEALDMGQVALVVGGSSGMGRDTAVLLGRRGATVIVAARRQQACEETAEMVRAAGGRAVSVVADATDAEQCQAVVDFIEKDHDSLDAAFNNAGKILAIGTLADADPAAFVDTMMANAGSAFHGLRAQIPLMARSGGGAIVINAATSGLRGQPPIGVYSAAKAAAINLARVAAKEAGPAGIRVNVVAPGYVATDAWMTKLGDQADALAATVPLRRIGAGADVAETVAWLLSDAAGYINGTVVTVDGGLST